MRLSKVNLRKSKNTKGDKYYYRLDIYPPVMNKITGKEIRFISTGMWTWIRPKTDIEKNYNKETSSKLKAYQAKYQLDIQNRSLDFLNDYNANRDFLEYFLEQAEKRNGKSGDYTKWMIVYGYLKDYSPSIKFRNLNVEFVEKFKYYLLNKKHKTNKQSTISVNSAASYFSKLILALNEAYKYDIIKEDIAKKVGKIKTEETKMDFLTMDEVSKLKNSDCIDYIQKQICFFMILSGQRVSDVENLKWKDIEYSKDTGYYIRFSHKKTKNQQTLMISDEAIELLGERGKSENLIFQGFKRNYRALKKWAKDAEVDKNIGYHIFRHTSAVLLISNGVDVYKVKERLGHRNIANTMVYLDLLNKEKIKVANVISLKNDING